MRLSELPRDFEFVKAAELKRSGDFYSISFTPVDPHVLKKDVIYLITREQEILYIGQTRRGLKKRVTSYADKRHSRLRYVHREMRNELSNDVLFEIWAYSPKLIVLTEGYSIQPLADFERMLVEKINPKWNRDLNKREKPDDDAAIQNMIEK